MNKSVFLQILIFIGFLPNLGAQSLRIESEYFGYYLSIDFVISFENTKNYAISKHYLSPYDYDNDTSQYMCIRVDHSGIWGIDMAYRTGQLYEVRIDGVNEYQFENENHLLYIDKYVNNVYKYKKISNRYNIDMDIAINEYLGRIVLNNITETNEIILNDNIITIPSFNNEQFRIETWAVNLRGQANLQLWRFDTDWWAYLDILNDEYIIYELTFLNTPITIRREIWRKKL
jgi:hypothetical protein